MVRREQKKVVEERKEAYKVAVNLAADSERNESQVDEKELERQRKRQAGRAVTVETFNAWKVNFEREMALLKGHTKSDADDLKISGKQYFLLQQASGTPMVDETEEERLIVDGEQDDFILEEDLGEEDDDDDEDYVEGEEDESNDYYGEDDGIDQDS
jgi:hypothetical protein